VVLVLARGVKRPPPFTYLSYWLFLLYILTELIIFNL